MCLSSVLPRLTDIDYNLQGRKYTKVVARVSYSLKFLGEICNDFTESEKSKMTASKPEVPISEFVDKIGMTF